MSTSLGLSEKFVTGIARGATYEYKTYTINKRTGGLRTIHHPSRRLKALQRWLLINVIETLPVHPSAMAYRKGLSILDNARLHAESRYLLRMDLTDFFPSITESDLRNYIRQHSVHFLGWTTEDIDVVSGLVCRRAALTIGAPSSPALSNALCYDLDVVLHTLAEKRCVTYSRYADDLFFSTRERDVLFEVEKDVSKAITEIEVPGNLKLNTVKTRHSSKRGARRVTGIVLGSDGLAHVGRGLKRKIRSLIYSLETLDQSQRKSLAGMIAYASG